MEQKQEKVEMGQAGVPLVFTVYKDGVEVEKKEFNQRSILVGRGDAANLRVDDPKASKLHAVIDITTKEDIHILDLGSTNGTKVNGEKIHRQNLKPGDEITVGHTSFKFAHRELRENEEKSVERFQATFENYFDEKPEPGESELSGRERRKVIEVAQIWGDSIVQMTHFMRPKRITIGETEDCDFFAPRDFLDEQTHFPIVANVGTEYFLQFTKSFSGTIDVGGKQTSLLDLAESGQASQARDGKFQVFRYKIEPEARVRVDLGSLSFLIQRVRPAKVAPADFLKSLDYGFLSVMGLVLFLLFGGTLGVWVLSLIGALGNAPPDDLLSRNDDIVQALVIAPEKLPDLPVPKVVKKDKEQSGNKDAGEGDKARGDEGKRGKKDGKVENSRGGAFKAPTDKDIVDGAGVLGALTADNADLNAIFGSGKLAGGMNDNIGGLVGSTTADQIGSGGLGLKGNGKGGGGNSLNIGGLGTKGRGTGASGHGSGAGVFGKGKGDASIGIGGEDTVIMGSLDPAIIDAVIKRHLAQIQYCYERELPSKPKLNGKIVEHFIIEGDGRVSTAATKSTTMNDGTVESCIAERFKMIRFPNPKGGGIVTVNYPLLFKSSGE